MKALIVNSQVLAVGAADVNDTAVLIGGVVYPLSVIGDYALVDAVPGVQPGWGYSGGQFTAPTPPALSVAQYIAGMEINFDAQAQSRNYDNRTTCALRAGYPGPFHNEGMAFAQWMDASNARAYEILAAVQAGQRPAPVDVPALLAELPQLVWPS